MRKMTPRADAEVRAKSTRKHKARAASPSNKKGPADREVPKSLKTMVRETAASIITVNVRGGAHKHVNAQEALLRQVLYEAANGNVKALKEVFELTRRYIRDESDPPKPRGSYICAEVSQGDVDVWRKKGFLPEGCPKAIADISAHALTCAHKAYNEYNERRRHADYDPNED